MTDADLLRADAEAMREEVRRRAADGHWTGSWSRLCDDLADVARVDLCLARLVEGHADAVRILAQAGDAPRPGTYGVWASRSVGTGLRARSVGGRWHLDGELRFASGVGVVDRVLVPGWLDERTHVLLDVPADRFEPQPSSWPTPAMDASRSLTVRADDVVADAQVGPPGFYLDRPGFAVGGIGPAAVWVGGAASVLAQVVDGLRRFDPTPHQLRRVGAMTQEVWAAERLLAAVAAGLPDDLIHATGDAPGDVARVRTAAALTADRVAAEAAVVVGPAGLTATARLPRTLADLALYVRQHHLDGALESLGRDAVDG